MKLLDFKISRKGDFEHICATVPLSDLNVKICCERDLFKNKYALSQLEIVLDARISGQACDFCTGDCLVVKYIATMWIETDDGIIVPVFRPNMSNAESWRQKVFVINWNVLREQLLKWLREHTVSITNYISNDKDLESYVLNQLKTAIEKTPRIQLKLD